MSPPDSPFFISVTLRSTGSQKFKGFLLEARGADTGTNQDTLLGTLAALPTEDVKLLACSDVVRIQY